MTVLVCGGRNYSDAATVARVLAAINPTRLIAGGAAGLDTLAQKWAESSGVPCKVVPADWATHGRSAGPIRNTQMLDMRPDVVVAFPGGSGTLNMVAKAANRGVRVIDWSEVA